MVPTAGHLMHGFQAQPVFPIWPPKARLKGREEQVRMGYPQPASVTPAASTHLVVLPVGEEID